ncbi:MAG: hypothetical protein ACOVQR_02265 [Flavobacterium sp.]|jgi:hypothetical protein|uniref:hypothetical protein n=1 Tax=Flavobacterium sp. TaxID=239 RepID=UPI003BA60439
MKKITFVVFIALLSLRCSKDDASLSEESSVIIQVNPLKNLNNGLVKYPIINSKAEQVGEIEVYHDATSIYVDCQLNPSKKIKKAGLFLGDYKQIPKLKKSSTKESFNQLHEFETAISSSFFTFSQAVLNFDENGCIYIYTLFEIEDTEKQITEVAFITTQLLPGDTKKHHFLYCVK